MKNKILEIKNLNSESLLKLAKNEILALHIPNFMSEEKCISLSKKINELIDSAEEKSSSIYDSYIDSLWNVLEKNELNEKYFYKAIELMRASRELSGSLSPMDQIRLELDEIWPSGANIMRINNRPMFFGIPRLWKENSEALPHQDVLRRELNNQENSNHQISQLGLNLYLSCAEEGGELEVWDYSIDENAYSSFMDKGVKGSYGFNRDELPLSSIKIKPKTGDLILINTFNVHAVNKIIKGQRLTLSGFIGYWGAEFPLKLWS